MKGKKHPRILNAVLDVLIWLSFVRLGVGLFIPIPHDRTRPGMFIPFEF